MALSPYQQKVKDDGPAAAFSFNEVSGPIRDFIRNLDMGGSGLRTYQQLGLPGIGYGVKFNEGYFTTLSDHFYLIGNKFGFGFWAKQPGVPVAHPVQYLFHRNGCFSCNINGFGQMVFVARDVDGIGRTLATDITTLLTDNEYHHYYFNYNGTSLVLYVDGALWSPAGVNAVLTVTTTFGWQANARLAIGTGLTGNSIDTDKYWYGTMSEFAYYQKSLTQDKIEDHWLLGTLPTHEGTSLPLGMKFRSQLEKLHLNMVKDFPFKMGATLDQDLCFIDMAQPWWDFSYPYRRKLEYTAPPDGLPAGHPVYVTLSKNLVTNGKVKGDMSNVKVAYLQKSSPQTWIELACDVETDKDAIYVKFPLAEDIAPNTSQGNRYFVYYGKRNLLGDLNLEYDTYDEWYYTLTPDSTDLDYTHPGKDWIDGKTTEYLAKMSLRFYGDRIQLWANLGPDQGIAEVQINELPWQKIDLYSPTVTEVPVMTIHDLPSGVNYLRYRAIDQNNPSSLGNQINFTKVQYGKHSTFLDIREEADDTKPWGSSIGGMLNANS